MARCRRGRTTCSPDPDPDPDPDPNPTQALLAASLAQPAAHRGLLLRLLLAAAAVATDPAAWLAATVQLITVQLAQAQAGWL